MISLRRTRLVRVPGLHAFRDVVVRLATDGDPLRARDRVVIVPTRDAARQLRRTLEDRLLPFAVHATPTPVASRQLELFSSADRPEEAASAIVLPDLVTRDELIDVFRERLADAPRRLTRYEREALMRASARWAADSGFRPPFAVRPGLVAEMVRFYDQLRNQARALDRFEELAAEVLGRDAEFDSGAERLLRQTRFLAAAFHEYERRVDASGAEDEHAVRSRALSESALTPVRDVVVTVADWIGDPDGLFLADFDLLTRVPGLETIDVVATDTLLASGFHQRIHDWLPGIDEVSSGDLGVRSASRLPMLIVPERNPEQVVFRTRDREEEMIAVARAVKADWHVEGAPPLAERAVVFKRPLPYMYLGRAVFTAARLPHRASAALPLAAEPFAAALDIVLECVESNFTRTAIVALLRSPHLTFTRDASGIEPDPIAALDRALSRARYLGELDRLRSLLDAWRGDRSAPGSAVSTLELLWPALEQLEPLAAPAPASEHLRRLIGFLREHSRPVPDDDDLPSDLLRRGRAAVLDTLGAISAAHAAFDDEVCSPEQLAAEVRRWIEEATFAPQYGDEGIQLLDDQAARYGDFADITIMGMVEGEWPERPRRNIFYPPAFLASLGWPSERDRRGAAEARFVELLASASRQVRVSAFELDDDALVEPSTLIALVPSAGLPLALVDERPGGRVLLDEALSIDPPDLDALDEAARQWAELRLARSPATDPTFHGATGAVPQRAWSISALETYLQCPFKFFARSVLRLEEEPDDEEAMDPRREGEFVHAVFETFFREWVESGGRAVTPDTLAAARTAFLNVVDASVGALSPNERALMRTKLLGSAAAVGLGEAVLRMEAERPVEVAHRLLEHPLEGDFLFETPAGPRTVPLRGKADRIDLLADGTFRLIDYKLGRPPNKTRSLQLPIYSLCAEQRFRNDAVKGRRWILGEAMYLAFRGPRRVVPLCAASDLPRVMADAQERLVTTVDAIGRGEFPPHPEDERLCTMCSFASVCRKDYVGDV